MITASNEQELKENYTWAKQVISEKYRHTPEDQAAIDNKGQDALISQWSLPKTTISLTNSDGLILITYHPVGLQGFDKWLREQ
ncbi:MAG TPA: hypothetical protein VII11_00385, partial [Bacteroidota bacterium]